MNEINDLIREGELEFRSKVPYSPPWWISILPTLVIIVVFVLFWVFFLSSLRAAEAE